MPPAARTTDLHVCPLINGLVPHVGGPVIMGAPTVLIGMMPAARVSDMCTCVGPTDPILVGSPTVMIEFKPAARMGDSTMHGGKIVIGFPTVMIGDMGMGRPVGAPVPTGGIVWQKQPGATDADLAKAQQMWEDAKSRRNPDGSKPPTVLALEGLENSDKTTTIMVGPDGNYEQAENVADGMNPAKGTNTTIHFNPNKTADYNDGTPRDPESSQAHEAMHAWEDVQGITPATSEQQEVSAATAENQHRKAKGLPQRQKYGDWPLPQF